ncbi:MAG: division/cell wall cluster transcriptional repressor MraZ [Candidatus Eisenbacteria bacterium]|nr:division/cell wall cluster transcriptional repressor MraZ [Candidatus Eisenbacteria bacterium]
MENLFKGKFLHSVDHKGRVSIPKAFKQILKREPGGLVILKGFDGCLFLYSKSGWHWQQQELQKIPLFVGDARRVERMLLENAYDTTMDSVGRVKIPNELLVEANFDKEVLVLGVSRRIEIWNPKDYEAYKRQTDMPIEQLAEKLFPGWGSNA